MEPIDKLVWDDLIAGINGGGVCLRTELQVHCLRNVSMIICG